MKAVLEPGGSLSFYRDGQLVKLEPGEVEVPRWLLERFPHRLRPLEQATPPPTEEIPDRKVSKARRGKAS